ncbi:MAG TPA: periplasmic heavy metal sensor [bacterium]|nr:periplasmic heavy metal sensor [bacterium]
MRLSKTSALFFAFVALCAGPAATAEWHPAQEAPQPRRERAESRAQGLSSDLNLTADQQEKLRAIYQERDKKLKSLYEDFRAKREAVKTESDAKFQALLTPEQREKLKTVNRKKTAEKARSLERKGLKTN